MTPVTQFPATKGPSKRTPNHRPNSWASLIARQTRWSGACNRTSFSIRSELMCNLLVAQQPNRASCGCATIWLHQMGSRGRSSARPAPPVDYQGGVLRGLLFPAEVTGTGNEVDPAGGDAVSEVVRVVGGHHLIVLALHDTHR